MPNYLVFSHLTLHLLRVHLSKVHPDREGGSAEVFEAVAAAYKTLGDPVQRTEYERGDDMPREMHYGGEQGPSVYEQVKITPFNTLCRVSLLRTNRRADCHGVEKFVLP